MKNKMQFLIICRDLKGYVMVTLLNTVSEMKSKK